MKIMVASDIHGSARFCRALTDAYERERKNGVCRLLLLGDLLYHGPRNDLPEEYDPRAVSRMLGDLREHLLCVRGNCDSEVDQMVLNFPILSDSALLFLGNRTVYATHGHRFSPENLPPLQKGDVLLTGHTHIPASKTVDGILCLNPGSVSIPKEGSPRGYLLIDETGVCFRELLSGDSVWEADWSALFQEN